MKRIALVVALAVMAGCSPKSATIPPDPANWGQLTDKTKDLSPEDRRLFAAYLARQGIAGALSGGKPNIPAGTTIGQAIDAQRKFETDAANQETQDAILRAKAGAVRAAAEAKLTSAATVTLVSKTFVPKNIEAGQYSDRVQFVIAIQNKTAKDISGIKGILEFDDMFGTLVKNISLSFDDGVAAGQMHTSSNYYFEVNQFDNDDNKLAQTDLSKLRVTFHPDMIVFADGTRMTTPDQTDTAP